MLLLLLLYLTVPLWQTIEVLSGEEPGGAEAGAGMESTLRNSVEGKQLDFNAPLLSVRRFASPTPRSSAPSLASSSAATTVTLATPGAEDGGKAVAGEGWVRRYSLPFYNSDLKSGPVRNPGVVPFVWEQSPGRPKDDPSGHDDPHAKPLHLPPPLVAPKPPPGGPLPMSPSTPNSPAPLAAATSTLSSASLNGTTLFKSMEREDSKAKPKLAAAEPPALEEKHDSSDGEDGDEDACSDSPDALSRTESCSMNCSTSGLSSGVATRAPWGGFSTDPQVREFMMGRFLPAAQAMTAESPQRAARKPPVRGSALPRRVHGVEGGRRPPASVTLPYHYQHWPGYTDYDVMGGYHDVGFGGDRAGAGRRPVKGRGWLPRLCLRGSLCLLNPIPVIKVRGSHMMNGSDRCSEFTVESRRSGGSFVVKACEDTPLQYHGSVRLDPHRMGFVGRSDPLKKIDNIEEVFTEAHVVVGSQPLRVEPHGKNRCTDALDLLPPALPKSPSESWLCQALPSALSKSAAPHPFLGVQVHSSRQVLKASYADSGWETMAKTSALPKPPMRFVDVLSRPANED